MAFMVRKIILLCGLLTAIPAQAQTLQHRIDSLFAPWNHPDKPGAAVVLMRGDSLLHAAGYGAAHLEYDVPITPSTVFMVASVSKQFTAYAIAMLAAEGALSLDDAVRSHVPELHAFEPPVTIRQLIHHTSGLRDEFALLAMAGYKMDDVITKDDILRLAYRQRNLNFEPGTEYLYSNTGYTLLAEIVERVTGITFSDWTQEHLFDPLQMHQTHFRNDHSTVVADLAQGYYLSDSTYKAQWVNYSSVGASGLYTTALDLARWLQNLNEGTVGSAAAAMVHERGVLAGGDTIAYAFGLSHDQFRGTRTIGHSGSHRGYRAWAGRVPAYDLSVAVLGNLEEFNPSEMAYSVLGLVIDDVNLADYAGSYYSAELDMMYTVTAVADGLRLRSRRGDTIHLSRTGMDEFSSETWYMSTVGFKREDGRVAGFDVSSRRASQTWFSRLDP